MNYLARDVMNSLLLALYRELSPWDRQTVHNQLGLAASK